MPTAALRPATRETALATLVFAVLLGQPVVVVAALSLSTPTLPSLAVVAGGTLALAVTAARAFVRQGRSVGRLAEFLVVLGAVQLVAALALGAALGPGPALAGAARPAAVVLGYPVAYGVVYRGAPVSPATWLRDP
ncbi:MAG: hypothetical protein ABEJ30_07790 [Halorientalis sp.]